MKRYEARHQVPPVDDGPDWFPEHWQLWDTRKERCVGEIHAGYYADRIVALLNADDTLRRERTR